MIKSGYYLGKVDFRHAYRSVLIYPSNYEAAGSEWQFKGSTLKYTFPVDSRLHFGARKSPDIFDRFTQAVWPIMTKGGFDTIIYSVHGNFVGFHF